MKALVLGLGISGKAAAKFLRDHGYAVTCVDDRAAVLSQLELANVEKKISSEISDLSSFDLFVPAPGIPRTHPLYVAAKNAKLEIAGELELALRQLQGKYCIAVTGTNGKTTVVKLIEHVLCQLGFKARALGNVGEPLIDHIDDATHLVIELSSFQLETMKTQSFDVGIILNITEDHLDRYLNFEEYAQTKCHLQQCLKKGGELIVHETVAPFLQPPYTSYTFMEEMPVGAPHDRANATAAFLAVKKLGISCQDFLSALQTFVKPAHRIEFVASVGKVNYYNDSKATNVDAAVKALEAMQTPVVLLAGGVDKGGSYEPLLAFKDKIKQIFVFGQSGEKIEAALKDSFAISRCQTLDEAVKRASQSAKPGETVLLAPCCSSYDQFRSYAHRGEVFRSIVSQLKEKIT